MALAVLVGCDRDGFLDIDNRRSRLVRALKEPKEFSPEGWPLKAGEAFRTVLRFPLNWITATGTVHTRSNYDYSFCLLCKTKSRTSEPVPEG
jgi:hypothetical protein